MSTKLRAACDNCHRAKVRCSGQLPCQGCLNSGTLCFFSLSDRLGRPKGTKNRSSEERQKQPSARKAATATRKANNHNNKEPSSNRNESSGAGHLATTTNTTTITDIHDHDWNGSSLEDGFRNGFDFLESHNNQLPFEGQLHTNPHDSDFSALLWTNTEADFLQEVAPSDHDLDNVMLDPAISVAPTAAPPMEMLLGEQTASTSSCACMQQQVDLLFKTKILNNAQPNDSDYNQKSVMSIDSALALVEEGMKTWQMPMMCSSCRCNDDQEVILLAFMSIQAITRYFQRLLEERQTRLNNGNDTISHCPIKAQLLTIGGFQIQGEDRLLLLKTLILNTVRKLRWILTSLQKILEEKIDRFPAPEAAAGDGGAGRSQLRGNACYMQQMFHGLAGSLQSIQEIFG